ncbi:MAG: efflux transporter outer membrane subunit [Rhodoferax sp.]
MKQQIVSPLALALTATLLSACSMIPAYHRPAAPVAATWPGQPAAAGNPTAVANVPWQTFFGDPRLRELIELALANNRDLRVAVLNIEQARAQFQIRRADQFPTVGAAVARTPTAAGDGTVNVYSAGLGISNWELDFFGRLGSLKEAARAQYLATEEGRKAAQISLIASVANGYLNLLADDELLELTRQTLATRADSLKLTRLRLDHGAASELDSRQAESLYEGAQVTLAQQQRQRAQDENALVLLLGQPLPPDFTAAAAAPRLADAALLTELPAGLPSSVLINRPDVRQAEQQLIAANANIGAARAAFFPQITLTAQAGLASTQLSELFKSGTYGWTLASQLLLPIFDSGRRQAGLDTATAGRAIAVAQYEKAIQSAFREVADALAGRATLGEQLRAQQAQAQAEAVSFKLADLRYRNGVTSYLDNLDAQRSLFAAQQAVVQTRLLQLQNQVTLYKTLGGGWTNVAGANARAASQ